MSEIKKIVVFGATGTTGLSILRRAIKEGLDVTAFVRTPSKVPEELRNEVKIIQGDSYNREKVEQAIEGQDAVLSALGPPRPIGRWTILTEASKNIVSGMKKHGIKKLVVVSLAGGWIHGNWQYWLLKGITGVGDHAGQRDCLKAESDSIDWIALMAPWIRNDDTINPGYLVEKEVTPGEMNVTSGEMADFMVKALVDKEMFEKYKHEFVGISTRPRRGWFS